MFVFYKCLQMYKSNLETGFLMKSDMGLLPAGEQTENENFTQKKV
jgi:hypothetical protein